MENRGSVACRHRWLLQLLLLLSPPHTRQGQALGLIVLAESAQDPPARYLSNGPGQEPVSVMTIDLTKISKPLSSFEFRTLDPEGVIFYGDTNTEDDWFMLGLRDGQLEIQLYNLWARLTVGFGPQLNDGRWHQMEIPRLSQYVELKMNGDSLLLWVDGKDILCLRQVSRSLADSSQTTMRIALGGLLPASRLRLPLAPALDGCIRRDTWLGHQAQLSPSAPTSLGNCDVVDLQPGLFFPAGTHAEFSLQDIPQPHTDPWSFSLELGLKLAEGSGCLLALGTGTNSSWLTLHLQDHVKEEEGGAVFWSGAKLSFTLGHGAPSSAEAGCFQSGLEPRANDGGPCCVPVGTGLPPETLVPPSGPSLSWGFTRRRFFCFLLLECSLDTRTETGHRPGPEQKPEHLDSQLPSEPKQCHSAPFVTEAWWHMPVNPGQAELGESGPPCHPWLHNMFETSLGYGQPCR
ncbi:sex hormone-binding globulin isoform X2 [Peromyscus maniculatus bairdii]|uniref:sex hormone-binding globulin isoform X2 n=1 Tax=Peromyscus maniculatus bairdii TaxID=230844 RepID=UPI001C2EF388|nr:sex hormone-binding globulin isoform X2 [Peromyscus maniculatus bairdii]